jgi:hypothetical protein
MPTEQEELKLIVSFVDNASAGIAKLRQELQQASSGSSLQAFDRIRRESKEVAEVTKGLGTQIEGAFRQLGQLRAGLGAATIGMTAFGYAVIRQIQAIKDYAAGLNNIAIAAHQIGVSPGTLKNLTEQFEAVGVSANEVVASVGAIQGKIAELQRPGSQLWHDMVAGAGAAGSVAARIMDEFLKRLAGARSEVDQLNMIRQAGENIYQNRLRDTGNQQEAIAARNSFWAKLGYDARLAEIKQLQEMTAEQRKRQEVTIEAGRQLTVEFGKVKQLFNEIVDISNKPMLENLKATLEYIEPMLVKLRDFMEWWEKHSATPPPGFSGLKEKVEPLPQGQGAPDSFLRRFGDWWSGGGKPIEEQKKAIEDNTKSNKELTDELRKQGYSPMSYTGAGIGGGLLQQAAFRTAGGAPMFGGGGGTWGGAGGGGGGGGWAGFGGTGEGTAAGAGLGAGRAGMPSREGGGAAGGDLDRGAYDKMFGGTPLAGQYDTVVAEARKNGVSPALVAGIMAHETGKGTSAMLRERLNPAGLMDPKTNMMKGQTFGTIQEGIGAAARTIAKNYQRGGGTIEGMAGIYAPSGAANDPRGLNKGWSAGVSKFTQELTAPGSDVAAGGGGAGGTPRTYERRRGDPEEFNYAATGAFGRPGTNQTTIQLKNGKSVTVNATVADRYKGFLNELIDRGYNVESVGGYAYRGKRGGGGLSMHAYGAAVDINPGRNAMGGRTTDMPGDVEQMAWQHDLSWGGRFGDPMHFEPMGPRAIAAKRKILEARQQLNKDQAAQKVEGTGKITVDVNAPKGTRVSAEGGGLFKQTEISRQTQMQPAQAGPETPGI